MKKRGRNKDSETDLPPPPTDEVVAAYFSAGSGFSEEEKDQMYRRYLERAANQPPEEPTVEEALINYCQQQNIGAPHATALLRFVTNARAEGIREARAGLRRHVELKENGEFVLRDGDIVCETCRMPQYAWDSTPYCYTIADVPETIEIRGKTYDLGSAFNMQTLYDGGAQFKVTDTDLIVTFPEHLSPVQLAECALALVVLSADAWVVAPTLELDEQKHPTFTLSLDDVLANLEDEEDDEISTLIKNSSEQTTNEAETQS